MLAGSWSKWQPQVLLPVPNPVPNRPEIWGTEIQLPDNVDVVYRYKFIVDGEWMYDLNTPNLPNDHGSFDNYVKVKKSLVAKS